MSLVTAMRASHALIALCVAGVVCPTRIAAGGLLDLGAQGGPNDRYRYVGATPTGALIGTAGAAALATGVYLRWHRLALSAPTVGIVSSDGIVAGWATAF